MTDFIAAVGLVFIIEGVLFAGFPGMTKRGLHAVSETPEVALRLVGLLCAVIGLLIVWLIRG